MLIWTDEPDNHYQRKPVRPGSVPLEIALLCAARALGFLVIANDEPGITVAGEVALLRQARDLLAAADEAIVKATAETVAVITNDPDHGGPPAGGGR